ncbi:MAG TPA: type IV pilin protein [Gammaproteobacteria bacterium]|nr:type IV pilin protein [Gammaproteobacteria bacterium]
MSNRENWKAGMREPELRRRRVAGFTLIEIVVTLSIIGLLAAIAYPSFMSSVRRGNHTDAQAAITRLTNNLERFFATNGTYTTDVTQLGFVLVAGVAYSEKGHYSLTVAAGPSGIGSSYVVTTTAKAGDMQAGDTGCTVLTLDSLGVRTPNPNATNCW